MRLLNPSEATELLRWRSNHLAEGNLNHPSWKLCAHYDWETCYVGDLTTIAQSSVELFGGARQFIHWTTFPGLNYNHAIEQALRKGFGLSVESAFPLIVQADASEASALVGMLCYRAQSLADHFLFAPGEDCALALTNDGECFLYSETPNRIQSMLDAFRALGDSIDALV